MDSTTDRQLGMSEIPPEGDEYNARRQEDLHAAIANKAALVRRHAEMIRDGAPLDQIAAIIDTIAQIEREIPHISKDLAVSVQGRNLSIFLDRMEQALADVTREIAGLRGDVKEVLTVSKESTARLGKELRALNKRHGGQIKAIEKRMDASEVDRADLRARLVRIEEQLKANGDGP